MTRWLIRSIYILLFPALLFGQGMPLPDVQQQQFGALGLPDSAGFICTYAAGTSTPLATYSDSALTTNAHNPIQLNAAGRPVTWGGSTEIEIFAQARAYKIVIHAVGTGSTCNGTAVGAVISTRDNISPPNIYSASFATQIDDKVTHCSQYTAGSDFKAKYDLAAAALPSTGGTVDCRGLEGDNTITSTITVGTTTKPIRLLLPAGRVISSANPVFRIDGGSWIVGVSMGSPSGTGGSAIVHNGTNNDCIWYFGSYGGVKDLTCTAGPNGRYGLLISAAVNSASILDNWFENIRLAGPTSLAGSKGIYLIAKDASSLVSFNHFSNIRITDFQNAVVMDSSAAQGPTNNTFVGIRVNGTSVAASQTAFQIIQGDLNSVYDAYLTVAAVGLKLDGGTKNSFYALDVEGNTLDANIGVGSTRCYVQLAHSQNNAWTNSSPSCRISTGNASIVEVIPSVTKIGDGAVGVPAGLPAATATDLYIAGGFASPNLGKIYVGDGSGWQLCFAKRTGSVDTCMLTVNDTAVMTLNPLTAATLPGVPVNGMILYCSDCTIANPCAGGGNGAFAKRLNGAWVCN